ncbi:HAD hydrolase-like protein [Fodinisporobacter ferrooxydans]|uniref:HAD hydrolase-like protein n=1 Tax=Fodinisporobacter ferrooxydans TaxID=2901836 RepID=A0ABY4CIT3_9BACL|nr:HAD hydrolase-like protein [Alicyclobacillaceae bacterium MYW30-H2]
MHTILFDVDGVFLKEERYFDASALCVWEILGSENYLGLGLDFHLPVAESTIRNIRDMVFDCNRVLNFIKSRGINSNWDMVFLQVSYQLVRGLIQLDQKQVAESYLREPFTRESLQELGAKFREIELKPDYPAFVQGFADSRAQKHELFSVFNQMIETHFQMECNFFSRNSSLWNLCQRAFQEWYIGEELYVQETKIPLIQSGKRGFLKDEIVLAPVDRLQSLLQRLQEKGYTLGIATGRPNLETRVPLSEIGVLKYFDLNRVVTASDVLAAEQKYPQYAPLAKPHPFCYLEALYGKQTDILELLTLDLPLPNVEDILIVGDSLADYYAAKAIGCKFAATLTGLSGEKARASFEALDTDYILQDVLEIENLLL